MEALSSCEVLLVVNGSSLASSKNSAFSFSLRLLAAFLLFSFISVKYVIYAGIQSKWIIRPVTIHQAQMCSYTWCSSQCICVPRMEYNYRVTYNVMRCSRLVIAVGTCSILRCDFRLLSRNSRAIFLAKIRDNLSDERWKCSNFFNKEKSTYFIWDSNFSFMSSWWKPKPWQDTWFGKKIGRRGDLVALRFDVFVCSLLANVHYYVR